MKRKPGENSVERRTFYKTLFCLQIIGFWLPSTITRNYQKVLYRFFSIFSYASLILQLVFIIINIIIGGKIIEDLLEVWFEIAVLLYSLVKSANLLVKRDLFYNTLRTSTLAPRWTVFRDEDEKSIVKESNKTEMLIFKLWGVPILLNCIFFVLSPILNENPGSRLMWVFFSPCDVKESNCFWVFYICQAYSYVVISGINFAYDCLIYSCIDRLCAYVKIFHHRLTLLPQLVKTGPLDTVESELNYIKQCITDHQTICVMATELHLLFNITVFAHFLLNFSVICTNVFTLTKLVLFSGEFVSVFTHLTCALIQNLLYSWHGYKFQEITEEIPYTIFSMDWTVLSKKSITLLRFTMLFGSKPIPLFNNVIVDLSPETFLKVIKLSYSIFNVLKVND